MGGAAAPNNSLLHPRRHPLTLPPDRLIEHSIVACLGSVAFWFVGGDTAKPGGGVNSQPLDGKQ
jgi:hypothetical protein